MKLKDKLVEYANKICLDENIKAFIFEDFGR